VNRIAKYSALLALVVSNLFAQNSNCKEQSMIVGALDAKGAPVKNLVAGDFKLFSGGRSVTVQSCQYREDQGRVVVLLDTSGSMRDSSGSNKWRIARAIVFDFVSSAPPKMQVSFATFADTVQNRFDASGGRQLIIDWLDSAPVKEGQVAKGTTALNEAILTATSALSPSQPGDAIYVITDGLDDFSKAKSSQIERLLQHSGVRLFVFLLFDRLAAAVGGTDPKDLEQLARRSGGFLVSLDGHPNPFGGTSYVWDDEVEKSLRALTRLMQVQMTSFYVLSIAGGETVSKAKDWRLDVVDPKGRKRKGLTLAYQVPGCAP